MSSTVFTDQTTIVISAWLNDVNSVVYNIIGDGTVIPATKAAARTNLGLGTMATQDSSAVTITGGSVAVSALSGAITLANGGTGGTDAATARASLSAAVSGANNDITSMTALAAGGLPNNSVLTADIANAQITAAKLDGAQTGSAPIYGVRAWAKFNGTTAGTNAPTAGGNVTTVTRNATGDYTVTYTTAVPSNSTMFGSASLNASGVSGLNRTVSPYDAATQLTTSCRVIVKDTSGADSDCNIVFVQIVG